MPKRGFVDTFFGLPTGGDVCRQKVIIFSFLSTKVSTNDRIRHWHCCWFCPTIIETKLNIMP